MAAKPTARAKRRATFAPGPAKASAVAAGLAEREESNSDADVPDAKDRAERVEQEAEERRRLILRLPQERRWDLLEGEVKKFRAHMESVLLLDEESSGEVGEMLGPIALRVMDEEVKWFAARSAVYKTMLELTEQRAEVMMRTDWTDADLEERVRDL